MRIIHGLLVALFWVAIAVVGFFVGWNLRAYKAKKDATRHEAN